MPNLNAALGCAQLENLNLFIRGKRLLANDYYRFFSENGIKFRKELENTKANYWFMCIELENKEDRDLFLKQTNKLNIMTPIWKSMDCLPMYKHCQKDDLKNTKFLEKTIVNIPSSFINWKQIWHNQLNNGKRKIIELVKNLFEDLDTENFNLDTEFKNNDEWDSMTALALITSLDEEFNVSVSAKNKWIGLYKRYSSLH